MIFEKRSWCRERWLQVKQDAVGAYIWASMYYACVKFFYVYQGYVSSAVALYILGVGSLRSKPVFN